MRLSRLVSKSHGFQFRAGNPTASPLARKALRYPLLHRLRTFIRMEELRLIVNIQFIEQCRR